MSTIQNKKIVAKEYPLKDILSNNKYSIDYFQREYRWRKENIDQLIDDLYNAFRADYRPEHSTKDVANYASYFMGSIVVIAKDDATMSIIDGQQRITSLTLLLIYLYHAIGVAKGAILQNMIFSDSYGEKSFNIQVPERKDCLDGLYNNNEYTPKDIDEDSVRFIADRYNDIKDSFPDDLQGQALESFMYWVINNIVIVKIEAYSEENAYTIFETMNDRGLNLTNSDMLKGFMMQKEHPSMNSGREICISCFHMVKTMIMRSSLYGCARSLPKQNVRAKLGLLMRTSNILVCVSIVGSGITMRRGD